MPKKKSTLKFSFNKIYISVLITLITFVLTLLGIFIFLQDKFYPQITVSGISISFLTPQKAEQVLNERIKKRSNQTLNLAYYPASPSGQTYAKPQYFNLNLNDQNYTLGINNSLNEAWVYGHKKIYFKPVNLTTSVGFSNDIDLQIKSIAQNINQPPVDSQLIAENGQITVSPSQDGFILNEDQLKKDLLTFINTGNKPLTLPIKKMSPKLSYETAMDIKKRLDQIKLSPLKLAFRDQVFTLDLDSILGMIDLENTESSLASITISGQKTNITSVTMGDREITDTKLQLNKEKVLSYLKHLSLQIDRPVEEPLFEVEPGSDPKRPRIKQFQAPQEGYKLNQQLASDKLSQALITQNQTQVILPVDIIKPKNKLTNDLGIYELIGHGQSNFAGSIPNRVYNIALAASKINGVLIPPGEIFSFVTTVGDITAATGYKQAYVIKSGRTVLDDGGGVCQVSTTVFRAALNSGLPIPKRTAHAYRVGYYEQGYPPGLDATIFYPSVDFQFKNDTPAHVLIQANVIGNTLAVDLYGTPDGRITSVSKPVITNQTPPPPELRQEDPTLPKGTVKQVDFSAWGANVIFSRTVTRNGQVIISESFRSNYRPWQAIFLVGTGG